MTMDFLLGFGNVRPFFGRGGVVFGGLLVQSDPKVSQNPGKAVATKVPEPDSIHRMSYSWSDTSALCGKISGVWRALNGQERLTSKSFCVVCQAQSHRT